MDDEADDQDQPDAGIDQQDLLNSVEDNKAMEVVRRGLNLRKPGCGNFWEDFIDICNDADGLSELLDVEQEKISRWASIIEEYTNKAEEEDTSDEKEIMPTGDETGPIANPAGNDNPQDGPAETRPM